MTGSCANRRPARTGGLALRFARGVADEQQVEKGVASTAEPVSKNVQIAPTHTHFGGIICDSVRIMDPPAASSDTRWCRSRVPATGKVLVPAESMKNT